MLIRSFWNQSGTFSSPKLFFVVKYILLKPVHLYLACHGLFAVRESNRKASFLSITNCQLTNWQLINLQLTNWQLINLQSTNWHLINLINQQLTNQQLTNRQLTNRQLTNRQLTNRQLTNQQLTNQQLTNRPLTNWRCVQFRTSPDKMLESCIISPIYSSQKRNSVFLFWTKSPTYPFFAETNRFFSSFQETSDIREPSFVASPQKTRRHR